MKPTWLNSEQFDRLFLMPGVMVFADRDVAETTARHFDKEGEPYALVQFPVRDGRGFGAAPVAAVEKVTGATLKKTEAVNQ